MPVHVTRPSALSSSGVIPDHDRIFYSRQTQACQSFGDYLHGSNGGLHTEAYTACKRWHLVRGMELPDPKRNPRRWPSIFAENLGHDAAAYIMSTTDTRRSTLSARMYNFRPGQAADLGLHSINVAGSTTEFRMERDQLAQAPWEIQNCQAFGDWLMMDRHSPPRDPRKLFKEWLVTTKIRRLPYERWHLTQQRVLGIKGGAAVRSPIKMDRDDLAIAMRKIR